MLEKFIQKFHYLFLQFSILLFYSLAWAYSFIFKRRKKPTNKKIAAIWYYPPDIPGSRDRLGHWKAYFEKNGFEFHNYYVSSIAEEFNDFEIGSWIRRYKFYNRIFYRRFKQFLQLKNYDIVWIDRCFIPKYPLKKAFFERCIKRMVNRLIIDCSDFSDYTANPHLVIDTIKQADTFTVAFKYLYDFFIDRHPDVRWINYTLSTTNYIKKTDYRLNDIPVLGWMGSPANMTHLKYIEKQLIILSDKVHFKLVIICRNPLKMHIPKAEIVYCPYNEEYFKLLSIFDIGLSPIQGTEDCHKGRIAMKHQEYMICGIPQVCSPIAISEAVVDEENVLIAYEEDEWAEKIYKLLKDEDLRRKLGQASNITFNELYTYEKEFPKLLNALVNPLNQS
jgi:glycosyltransferase involved in cell wall biosynthesis